MSGSSTVNGEGTPRRSDGQPTSAGDRLDTSINGEHAVRAGAPDRDATVAIRGAATHSSTAPRGGVASRPATTTRGASRVPSVDRTRPVVEPPRSRRRRPKKSRAQRRLEALASDSPARRARRQEWERDRRLRRKHTTILLSVLLGCLLIIAGVITFGVYQVRKTPALAVPTNSAARHDGLNVGGSGPVTIDVYVDYQCTGCRTFEDADSAALDQMVATNQVALVYHPVAMLDALSTTHYSTRAAVAAACAANMGMFLPYTKALYAQQPAVHTAGLSDDQMIQIAGDVGIIDPRFAQCVRDEKFKGWVTQVTERAGSHRVDAAPVVLVAGSAVSGPGIVPTAQQIQAAVARATAEASTKPR
jgi:protein-disulfide isomerase